MHTRLHWMAAASVAGALLSACGGGGGGGGGNDAPAPPATEIPDSALVSSASYTAFASTLAIDESADPLNVDKVTTAPSSETDDPATVD